VSAAQPELLAPILVHVARIAAALAGGGHVVDLTRGEGLLAAQIAPVVGRVSAVTDSAGARHGSYSYPSPTIAWIVADAHRVPIADGMADVVIADGRRATDPTELLRILAPHGWAVFVDPPTEVVDRFWCEVHRFELVEGPATLLRAVGAAPVPSHVEVAPTPEARSVTPIVIAGPPGTWSRIQAADLPRVAFGFPDGRSLPELVSGTDLEELVLGQREQLNMASRTLEDDAMKARELADVLAQANAREAAAGDQLEGSQRLLDEATRALARLERERAELRARLDRTLSVVEELRSELVEERRRSATLSVRASDDQALEVRLLSEVMALQDAVSRAQSPAP
jgi:hypothetical protein